MCGISGIIKRNNDHVQEHEIMHLTNSLAHRGPDANGKFIHQNCALGHVRLSIIDLANGVQPMQNESGNKVLTYNGEIYNYKEIRKKLQNKGVKFSTDSDTEVVLRAYECWGQDCVNHFDGMFAFAVLDLEKEVCFLARDHFGIKPLLYRVDKDFFAFNSELPGLVNLIQKVEEGSEIALEQFFTFNYIPAPNTIYKNIYKLEPGHTLTVSLSGEIISKKRYFSPVFSLKKINQSLEKMDSVLTEKIYDKMMSDVPFGVFLSGGIDSSFVTFKMSQKKDANFNAYSITFDGPHSEEKYAKQVSEKTKVPLVKRNVRIDEIEKVDELIHNNIGEPFGDNSIIPTWHVCNLASKDVKMVITGDGGDEFFAGYHSYASWMNSSLGSKLNEKIKSKDWLGIPRFVLGTLKQQIGTNYLKELRKRYFEMQSYFPVNQRKKLLKKPNLNTDQVFNFIQLPDSRIDFLSFAQLMDIQSYLPNDILHKVDIASMANGLETRPAFVDIDLFAEASKMSRKNKFKNKEGKYFLKKLMEKDFGTDFSFRRKQGFGVPNETWFGSNSSTFEYFKKVISNEKIDTFLDRATINEIWSEFEKDKKQFGPFSQLWLIFVFSLWLNHNENIRFT